MRTKNVTYVSVERFETLAKRHVTMQRNSVIVIQGEAHPESGVMYSVELKYDGDGYLLDGKPLMVNQRLKVNPWGHHTAVSGGCMGWKDSAARAIKLLSDKESQGAQEYCDMQDEMFMRASGYRW